MEETKAKFQEIQEAYAVLSDLNKILLYDVRVYDNDEDQKTTWELSSVISQTKPNESGWCSGIERRFSSDLQPDFDGGQDRPTCRSNRLCLDTAPA